MSVFNYPGNGAGLKECRWASALHSRDSSKFKQLRSLDVRACNLPAIGTYKSLGFEVQQKSARSCSPPSFTPKITESHPNEVSFCSRKFMTHPNFFRMCSFVPRR